MMQPSSRHDLSSLFKLNRLGGVEAGGQAASSFLNDMRRASNVLRA